MSLRKRMSIWFYIVFSKITFPLACIDIGVEQARVDYKLGLNAVKNLKEL